MNAALPIRVALAEDQALFREGVARMLDTDTDIEVVGEAENGTEAVELARREKPDVLLLDVEMPGMPAEQAIMSVLDVSPSTRVVMLTMYDGSRLVRKFMGLGAAGYMTKNVRMPQLLATVRASAQDESGVVLSISRQALDQLEGHTNVRLSDRELDILAYVGRGMSNAQIASTLYLTEGTIKRHLVNIFRKLKVSSRSEAVHRAMSERWIVPGDIGKVDKLYLRKT